MAVGTAQDGIGSGPFHPSARVLVNGIEAPWLNVDVTLAVYGVASMITADVPMRVNEVERDYGKEAQANADLPFAVKVGMVDTSGVQAALPMTQIETGVLEEARDHCAANMTSLTGKSTAAIFQDTVIADAADFSQRGDQIAKKFFELKKIPLVRVDSPGIHGRPGASGQYLRAYRGRTMWDEMRAAALADGYILSLHNGQGYYGPPPANMPIVALKWGRDLIDCEVSHNARRAPDIVVQAYGSNRRSKSQFSMSYSKAGPSAIMDSRDPAGGGVPSVDPTAGGRVYPLFLGECDPNILQTRAKAAWLDIVQHELTATLELAPDPPFLRMLCDVGGQFAVQLSGRKPSQNGLYYVREANLSMAAGESEQPRCTVKINGSNVPPAVDEAE